MDSSISPPTPAAHAAAFLESLPTAPRTDIGAIRFPNGLDPEEHDLTDWVVPAGDRAPAPSALLGAARALVEDYRAFPVPGAL